MACVPTSPEAGEKVLLGIAGDFNVENALVAIAAAREIGIGIDAIKKGLSKLRVPGRMEVVESKDGRVICVVDYAHNQLSFRSAFFVGEARVSRQPGHRSVWLPAARRRSAASSFRARPHRFPT